MNERLGTVNSDSVDNVTYSNIDADLSVTHNEIYDPEMENEEPELPVRELKFKQLQKKWEMLAEKQSPPENTSLRDTFSSRTM